MNTLASIVASLAFTSIGLAIGLHQKTTKGSDDLISIQMSPKSLKAVQKALSQISVDYKEASSIDLTISRAEKNSFMMMASPIYKNRGTFLIANVFFEIRNDGSIRRTQGH